MSPDAVIDEARGLVFPARIRITGSSLRTASLGHEAGTGPAAPLPQSLVTPGMSAAAEIRIGKRPHPQGAEMAPKPA
ncbi:MAG: hypothetical protein GVY06_04475 [Alphaproteobacteria bacterium]|nr:hypothetical protein [Alphaproteobacteria bacterium]